MPTRSRTTSTQAQTAEPPRTPAERSLEKAREGLRQVDERIAARRRRLAQAKARV